MRCKEELPSSVLETTVDHSDSRVIHHASIAMILGKMCDHVIFRQTSCLGDIAIALLGIYRRVGKRQFTLRVDKHLYNNVSDIIASSPKPRSYG